MDRELFRKYGYEFVDWIADYMDNVSSYSVRSKVSPGDIAKQLPKQPPVEGESMDDLFRDFKEIIMPGITHWQHPGWFAYFPSNNSPESILAELLTAGLGAQCMVWQTSPAAAELEDCVMEWLRQMLALPEGMEGVIQDTASTATLCALLTAREAATGFQSNQSGCWQQRLVVYTSEETHSSVEKGAKIAGYGKEGVHAIGTDEDFAMRPDLLRQRILEDRAKGLKPVCVVATIGTTSSAAVDPVREIGKICKEFGLWLHVDAAYAGPTAMLKEKRHLFDGLEYADSLVFNPHKWMLTNFDCSAYFVKDSELLTRTFDIHPEYLKTAVDKQVKNYRDWGVQLGRRFRALKLWFVIRSYGISGIQAMLREHIRLAEVFKQWVSSDKRFELLAPVHFSVVCFHYCGFKSDEKNNEFSRVLLERVNSSGEVFLTHTSLNGKFTIRMVVGQRTTTQKQVRRAWELIQMNASALEKENVSSNGR